MSLHDAGVLAGTVSTVLFVISYLPMLARAARTRDLSSYSPGNLVIANLGNLVHSLYVFSLPAGPLWLLHTFYLVSTALMLWWWCRHHAPSETRSETAPHPIGPASIEPGEDRPAATSGRPPRPDPTAVPTSTGTLRPPNPAGASRHFDQEDLR